MEQKSNKPSETLYVSIAKSNMVFGGIKILQAVIQLLKNKFVAILIGPVGLGVQSLLFSAITTLHLFTSLGISQSSVREISVEEDIIGKKKIVKTVTILALLLGVVSSILVLLFAKVLSLWVFNDIEHKWMFQIVSVSLLFETISNAQIAIFQGLRFVKQLAKMSLTSSFAGFILIIPIYYFGRENAIPYALVIGYFVYASIALFWRFKIYRADVQVTKQNFLSNSRRILSLGMALMISNCIMSLFGLGLNVIINRLGTSGDVGFFNAANACTYMVINILVMILASDYYPRLSSCIHNHQESAILISNQIELLLLVLTPIIFMMILFPSIIVRILYSSEFLIVQMPVRIMSLSLFFRIIWHSLSYVILAKGDKLTYLVMDAIIGNGLFFVGNIIGFYYDRLSGIAISYVIGSFLVMLLLFLLCVRKYQIQFKSSTILLAIILFLLCLGVLAVNILTSGFVCTIVSLIISILMACFVLYQINTRIRLITIVRSLLWKNR